MLMIAVILNALAAAGLVALAAKYSFGPVPADYHREILEKGGVKIEDTLAGLLGEINQVVGGCFFALAAALLALDIFGVYQDLMWAKVSLLVIAGLAGGPSTFVAYRMEQTSGVKTPWRNGAVLTVVILAAFVLSIL